MTQSQLPPQPNTTSSPETEIIALLMREYDALRDEVTQRIAARTQIAGFAGVIAALLSAGGGVSPDRPNLYIIIATVVVALIWWRDSNQGIQRLGRHLREIENEVNRLTAHMYGRQALTWETRRHAGRREERPVWRLVGRIGGWNPPDPPASV